MIVFIIDIVNPSSLFEITPNPFLPFGNPRFVQLSAHKI